MLVQADRGVERGSARSRTCRIPEHPNVQRSAWAGARTAPVSGLEIGGIRHHGRDKKQEECKAFGEVIYGSDLAPAGVVPLEQRRLLASVFAPALNGTWPGYLWPGPRYQQEWCRWSGSGH